MQITAKGGFPINLNILIIDDLILPEKSAADSAKKTVFYRLLEENYKRRLALARDFSSLGANVLLLRLDEIRSENFPPFEYREISGISQVFVPVSARKGNLLFRPKELLDFCGKLFDNSLGLSGLFKPDVVISGGVLPFSGKAAAKIAESAGAMLISEFSCSPAELLLKLGLCSAINPVLTVLKASIRHALRKSEGIISLFPMVSTSFGDIPKVFPMEYSAFEPEYSPTDEAKRKRDILSAFGEGETFVLAFPGNLESGFSIGELISVCSELGNKFALVFCGKGSKKAMYKKLVSEKGYKNIYFMDEISEEEAPFVLSAADGIFLSEDGFSKGLASDSKRFFSVFGAGRPIIASSVYHSEIFRKSCGTIITKPKNKDSTRLGIKTLMKMQKADRDILGRANRDFAEKNSAKNFSAGYFSIIENLLTQKESKK